MQMKTSKGITLIALIITIVVLLILAGVAIGTLEETDIIGRAKDAAAQYEEKKVEENTLIADAEEWLKGNTTTYADFWKAAYERIGKNNHVIISEHIYIGFDEYNGQVIGQLLYGDMNEEDFEETRYIIFMNNDVDGLLYGDAIEANQWYSATNGSNIDLSKVLPLPEDIATNKSGTPVAGYEDLCNLFNKAIGSEGCDPYIANAN